ncbi:TPA: hypothetical protein ACPSKB_002131 [Legionella feeleii]
MASETAAVAVVAASSSLGLIRGGLTAHGLFKEFNPGIARNGRLK